ncbi:dTMP kinase [Candidatus Kapabacteria bacterium]|nr:dTMP kinase [Candidatus Kapabacteria bacterium]
MFISFEGIDGAGKTTQIELLKNYLFKMGVEFISIREPGGTLLAEKIRTILLDPEISMPDRAELLLFEAARADLIDKVIKPNLEKGKIVICDRFYDSTTAYQSYGRGIDFEKTLDLHEFTVNNIHPDKTIFLNISLEESARRIRSKRKDRMEQSGDEFFKKVYNGFQELVKKYPNRIKMINANDSIKNIHENILNELKL